MSTPQCTYEHYEDIIQNKSYRAIKLIKCGFVAIFSHGAKSQFSFASFTFTHVLLLRLTQTLQIQTHTDSHRLTQTLQLQTHTDSHRLTQTHTDSHRLTQTLQLQTHTDAPAHRLGVKTDPPTIQK